MRRAEGEPAVWPAIAFGACIATATTISLVIALTVTLVHLAPALDASSMSLARDGAFAPFGVLPTLAPLTHFLWRIGVAVALLRKSAR